MSNFEQVHNTIDDIRETIQDIRDDLAADRQRELEGQEYVVQLPEWAKY